MTLIALASLPKFIRQRITFIEEPAHKRELASLLTSLIEEFFSDHSLVLEMEAVAQSYKDIPVWREETVLAKLRSLMEIQAKKKIRIFCSELDLKKRREAQTLLRAAGIYNFRDALDLDLYVGIHTAISAYFKMMGVGLTLTAGLSPCPTISNACRELFKNLRFIATLPLKYLMAVDGLFWDSKQYFIPKSFSVEQSESGVSYFLALQEIESRLAGVSADEEQTGCPALRARTNLGTSVFELAEKSCIECVEQNFLAWKN